MSAVPSKISEGCPGAPQSLWSTCHLPTNGAKRAIGSSWGSTSDGAPPTTANTRAQLNHRMGSSVPPPPRPPPAGCVEHPDQLRRLPSTSDTGRRRTPSTLLHGGTKRRPRVCDEPRQTQGSRETPSRQSRETEALFA